MSEQAPQGNGPGGWRFMREALTFTGVIALLGVLYSVVDYSLSLRSQSRQSSVQTIEEESLFMEAMEDPELVENLDLYLTAAGSVASRDPRLSEDYLLNDHILNDLPEEGKAGVERSIDRAARASQRFSQAVIGGLVLEERLSPGTRSRFLDFYVNVFAVYYEQELRDGEEDFPFEAVPELYERWME